ncbi:MAG: hypothetical protein ABSD80_10240, partial [Caulobacteraceae bacterium]
MRFLCASLAVVGLAAAVPASAAPIDEGAPAVHLFSGVYNPGQPVGLEQAQWFYGGQNYCWYVNGWRGPGFYWCGYAWRRGFGWGGGYGWRGWGGGYANGFRGGGGYRGGYGGGGYHSGYQGGQGGYQGGGYRGGGQGGGYHGGGAARSGGAPGGGHPGGGTPHGGGGGHSGDHPH